MELIEGVIKMNVQFQNALKGIPQNTPPVWMMRQAGRYHSHYQGIRSKYSFEDMCKNPELATEVAMGPIQDFDFDVAILFSDLLFILEGLGMGLQYTDKGPQLGFSLSQDTISQIKSAPEAIEFMQFQKTACQLTRKALPENKSLIGFVGGPWTLYAYAVEGHHSGGLMKAKQNLGIWDRFMKILMPTLIGNIELQLQGGAEVVMIFDTAAGEVAPWMFQSMISPLLIELAQKFPNRLGYYSKATQKSYFNTQFLQAPWAGLGFDHHWNMSDILLSRNSKAGIKCFEDKIFSGSVLEIEAPFNKFFIQGNFDQYLLHLQTDDFKKVLKQYISSIKQLSPEQRTGWVSGLGHGVLPKTPESHVKYFVDTMREVFA